MRVEATHPARKEASGIETCGLAPSKGKPEVRSSPGVPDGERIRPVQFPVEEEVALDLLATTLNQNNQQYDSNNAGYNPDNRYIVHVSSPFLLKELLKRLHHDDDRWAQGYHEN